MSDYLIINGESLEVEKKFDKCVVEGFDYLLSEVSVNTIVVSSGGAPGPSIDIEELTITENGTYQEEGKAYSPVTTNVLAAPTKYWWGNLSAYEALSTYEGDRLYRINDLGSMMFLKLGSKPFFPPAADGYDCIIENYGPIPTGQYASNWGIPLGIKISSRPTNGWRMEFNVVPNLAQSGDIVICGCNGSATVREVYVNSSGYLYFYANGFGDNQVYTGGISGKDVVIQKEINSNAFKIFVNNEQVYSGTMSTSSNTSDMLRLIYYSDSYCFAGTINYFKFKWLE